MRVLSGSSLGPQTPAAAAAAAAAAGSGGQSGGGGGGGGGHPDLGQTEKKA